MNLHPLPGDCYRIDVKNSVPHYFFIISAPDRFPEAPLVLVPMTSVSPDKNTDPACLLAPGDHHTCVKPTFIDYRRSVKLNLKRLESFILEGMAQPRIPGASPELLQRLRDGAEASDFLTGELRDLLYRQGLIRP